MSNLYFNIRFGTYHFQWAKDSPYFTFRQNPAQVEYRARHSGWKWFAIYSAFGRYMGE